MAESIFPFVQPDAAERAEELAVAQEWAWDFDTDQPIFRAGNPVWVERLAAVKVWAWNALHADRFRYAMHTANYGHDLYSVIGAGWSEELKTAEVRQYVIECLTQSPYIDRVDNFQVSFSGDTLSISFTLHTVYGTADLSI